MRKVSTVLSADQIDRLLKEARNIGSIASGSADNNLVPRHNLAVSVNDNFSTSLISSALNGQSKSSVDLHVSSKSMDHLGSPSIHRRSRSNSTGPSDAPIRYCNPFLFSVFNGLHSAAPNACLSFRTHTEYWLFAASKLQ